MPAVATLLLLLTCSSAVASKQQQVQRQPWSEPTVYTVHSHPGSGFFHHVLADGTTGGSLAG